MYKVLTIILVAVLLFTALSVVSTGVADAEEGIRFYPVPKQPPPYYRDLPQRLPEIPRQRR